MEIPVARVAAQQRRALDFMLETLGLAEADAELARPAPIDPSDRLVAALLAENAALRAQVCALERQLTPSAAELDAWERELAQRARRGQRATDGI